MSTGLYIREDEDIVIGGIPPLILRRTYLSGYRTSKQFGVGATHNGEIYLAGDFQNISLILAKGSRIPFARTGPGPLLQAVFEHRAGSDDWLGAQLRFTLGAWVLKRPDGAELTFKWCGPQAGSVCSIIRSRGTFGETIDYQRDASGRLTRIESGSRWIAFEYDARGRITRAEASSGRSVAYDYDSAGRLARVKGSGGQEHRYGYSDLDQLVRIEDPETTVDNVYDANGRVIRQVNRFPGEAEALTFTFSYRLRANSVMQTESQRSDSVWRRFTFNENHNVIAEEFGLDGQPHGTFTYERAPQTGSVSSLTITCPERNGESPRHTQPVSDGDLEGTKMQLVQACFAHMQSR
jgi:YD repeat-containing protein